MKIERILYPTDFTEKSALAREYAAYLAKSLNSCIHMLHAIEPIDNDGMDIEITEFYRDLEPQLKEKLEKEKAFFSKSGLEVISEIIVGSRWKVINNYANEKAIDLIVIGSHGIRNEDGSVSVGTTSHKVIFSSHCPVLVIKSLDGE